MAEMQKERVAGDNTETDKNIQEDRTNTSGAVTMNIESESTQETLGQIIRTERMSSFDVLRGLCIMGMCIDHVRGNLFTDPDQRALERFKETPDYYYLYGADFAVTTYRWMLRSLFPFGAPGNNYKQSDIENTLYLFRLCNVDGIWIIIHV